MDLDLKSYYYNSLQFGGITLIDGVKVPLIEKTEGKNRYGQVIWQRSLRERDCLGTTDAK